jgi:hypothetical protein
MGLYLLLPGVFAEMYEHVQWVYVYIISVYGVMSIMPQSVPRSGLFLVWGIVLSRGVVYGMLYNE